MSVPVMSRPVVDGVAIEERSRPYAGILAPRRPAAQLRAPFDVQTSRGADGQVPPGVAMPRPDSTWSMTLAAVVAQKGVMGNPPARSARAVHTLQVVST
jgi:hypothetical protein